MEKNPSFVSHNGKKPLPLYPTTEKTSSFLSHNGGKPTLLYPSTEYPTTEKNSFFVSQNGKKTKNFNSFAENKIFRKMILTHDSGSQEGQFDEKNGGQKCRATIPLKG
jgi:hypothetical protein